MKKTKIIDHFRAAETAVGDLVLRLVLWAKETVDPNARVVACPWVYLFGISVFRLAHGGYGSGELLFWSVLSTVTAATAVTRIREGREPFMWTFFADLFLIVDVILLALGAVSLDGREVLLRALAIFSAYALVAAPAEVAGVAKLAGR